MNSRIKIERALYNVIETIDDQVKSNIMSLINSKQLIIDQKQLEKLLAITSASIQEGYNKTNKHFMKIVDASISENTISFEKKNDFLRK